MNPKQKKLLTRIIVALVLFVAIEVAAQTGVLAAAFGTPGDVYAEFALFLIPYLIAGYDVIAGALRGLVHGHALDEDFLMTVATFGAFALVLFPDTEPHMAEGAAVMLFFQVGELFQSYAVDKSRQSIADMMDIAPEYANVMEEGKLKQVDPFELAPDDEFIVIPGERIPLDGTVLTGESQIDTAALTGESVPRTARPGDEVISGCVNLTAKLVVRATQPTPRTSSPASPACTPPSSWAWPLYSPSCPRCCSAVSGPTGSCADSPSSWCRAPAHWSSPYRCRSSAASAAPRASAF